MKMKRLAIDIDGVLANFNQGWVNLARELHGVEYPTVGDTYPDKWQYREDRLSKEQIQDLHERIGRGGFWSILDPYPDAKAFAAKIGLHSPIGMHTYFITQRHGKWVKWETELWLHALGVFNPTVLIVDRPEYKIPILDALSIDAFLEDNIDTAKLARTSNAYVYLLDRPWNRAENPDGIIRVKSILEFFNRAVDGKMGNMVDVAGMK